MRSLLLSAAMLLAALGPLACSSGPSNPGSDAGSNPGSDGGAPVDAGSCPTGLSSCGGECVNEQTDPAHCGSCGNPCTSGQACANGACVALPSDCRQSPCPSGYYCDLAGGQCHAGCAADSQCPQPGSCDLATHSCTCATATHLCGTVCLSSTSTQTCGSSCTPCPSIANGSATCDGTSCGLQCDPGYLLCNGACAPCPAGSSFTCSGDQCVPSACASGYHLCGGTCASDTDPNACGASCQVCPGGPNLEPICNQGQCSVQCAAGTTICKGQCSAASCGWNFHTFSTAVAYAAIAVDDQGVTHAVTTYQFNPTYWRISGPGNPTPDPVSTGQVCFEGSSNSVDTVPVVIPDGSGKAAIACVRGNMVDGFRWNGAAWVENSVQSSSSLYDSPAKLTALGDTVAYYYYMIDPYGGPSTQSILASQLSNNSWNGGNIGSVSAVPTLLQITSTIPNAEQYVWVAADTPAELYVATNSSAGFTVTQPTPPPSVGSDSFAQDRNGNLIVATPNLDLETWTGSTWSSERITSSSATAVKLVVDSQGIPRVAWVNGSGAYLATKIGSTWYVETLESNAQAYEPLLSVGGNGHVAVGYYTTSGYVIED